LLALYVPCRPRLLDLGAASAVLVSENLDVLRRNGFELVVGGSIEIEEEENSSEKVYLCAQPVSKETVFDFRGTRGVALLASLRL
jgi:hypothetical protein